MQIQKSRKILLVITVMLVIITFLSTSVITGCGRRARIIAAANEKKEQATEQNSQSQTEIVSENKKSDTEETVKESIKDEETTEAEESASVEESTEKEDNNTVESEDGVEDEETTTEERTETEESTEDEETTVSDSVEETTAEETTKYTADMPYVRNECANIFGGEFLYDYTGIIPGDTGEDDLEIRSFMSYDISQLLGATIKSAKIEGKANSLQGTPVDTYGPMIIKSVYWGTGAISPSEFDLNGTEITSISKTNFNKSPSVLKDGLQAAVNHGYKRYQLCFYFEMSQTDGDGESDYIYYPFPDIVLTVTYSK